MIEIYKPIAIALPFLILIQIISYLKTNKIEWIGISFILMSCYSLYLWIQDYRKNKFLKEAIEWV